MQKQYFDNTFWSMTARFLSVIVIMLGVYVALNTYLNNVYNPDDIDDNKRANIHETSQ